MAPLGSGKKSRQHGSCHTVETGLFEGGTSQSEIWRCFKEHEHHSKTWFIIQPKKDKLNIQEFFELTAVHRDALVFSQLEPEILASPQSVLLLWHKKPVINAAFLRHRSNALAGYPVEAEGKNELR